MTGPGRDSTKFFSLMAASTSSGCHGKNLGNEYALKKLYVAIDDTNSKGKIICISILRIRSLLIEINRATLDILLLNFEMI